MTSRVLLSYNFDQKDIEDHQFETLFCERRRDAAFAFAYSRDGYIYALRDHLGTIPLYYRYTSQGIRFSTNLTELINPEDELVPQGVVTYLKFGTPKLSPLVSGIYLVPPGTVIQIDPRTQTVTQLYRYSLTPRKIPTNTSLKDLTEELDVLFSQAIHRLIQFQTVGLYLSGGIDSALIGIYLRKAGVAVNAYTSAPWGRISSDVPLAKANAQLIGVNNHAIDYLETSDYPHAIAHIPNLYKQPHGTTTAIGVSNLWLHTHIAQEKQVFLGQNSDTMLCSVPAQHLTYFAYTLPFLLRRRLHPAFQHRNLVTSYLTLAKRFSQPLDTLCTLIPPQSFTRIQKLTHAGIFVAHTPSDGEVLTQPALSHNIVASNPYYDVDLIEFAMGIPFHHRVTINRASKLKVVFEKKILRALAIRYLPRTTVFRKKGFAVSFARDKQSSRLARELPTHWGTLQLERIDERFAAKILVDWLDLIRQETRKE